MKSKGGLWRLSSLEDAVEKLKLAGSSSGHEDPQTVTKILDRLRQQTARLQGDEVNLGSWRLRSRIEKIRVCMLIFAYRPPKCYVNAIGHPPPEFVFFNSFPLSTNSETLISIFSFPFPSNIFGPTSSYAYPSIWNLELGFGIPESLFVNRWVIPTFSGETYHGYN